MPGHGEVAKPPCMRGLLGSPTENFDKGREMSSEKRRSGFVCHELYMWHDTGNYAGPMPFGNPCSRRPMQKILRLKASRNLLEVSGLIEELHLIKPRMATESEILRFHTKGIWTTLKKSVRTREVMQGFYASRAGQL